MTRYEANKILNEVREGAPHSEACTLQCLHITGDYQAHEPVRGPVLDQEAEDKDWRGRVRERQILVGRSKE